METPFNKEELLNAVQSFAPDFYVAVRNPVWANAANTVIACEVNFKHVGFEEWTPFCADPNDFMPYSKQIFDECVAGQWGAVAAYVEPINTYQEAAENQPIVQGAQTL